MLRTVTLSRFAGVSRRFQSHKVAFPTKLEPLNVNHPEQKVPVAPDANEYEAPSFGKLAVRWPNMPSAERDDIIAYLNDRQSYDWRYLTKEDRQAIYYVCYGPWGPRDPNPPVSTGVQLLKLLGLSLGAGAVSVMGFCYLQDRKVLAKFAETERN